VKKSFTENMTKVVVVNDPSEAGEMMSENILFDNMQEFHRIMLVSHDCNIRPCGHINHLYLLYFGDSKKAGEIDG